MNRLAWERPKKLAPMHLPARTGAPWNALEINDLRIGYYVDGNNIYQLARRHQRGVNGIIAQLNRTSMHTQHRPNAAIFRAYADGKDVEFLVGQTWHTYSDASQVQLGSESCTWRVKPTVTKYLFKAAVDGSMMYMHRTPENANLELTLTDGKLTGASVLST